MRLQSNSVGIKDVGGGNCLFNGAGTKDVDLSSTDVAVWVTSLGTGVGNEKFGDDADVFEAVCFGSLLEQSCLYSNTDDFDTEVFIVP